MEVVIWESGIVIYLKYNLNKTETMKPKLQPCNFEMFHQGGRWAV